MEEIKYANCFVCGHANPVGLKLDFAYDEDSAAAWFDSPARYEGYQGVIHGGIIATLLDEAMAKIILKKGMIAVTADMNIKYRKPLPIGQKVKASGVITLQKSRTIHTKAALTDESGTIYAESTAVYIVVKHLP
ncbi:MAG: PaaI family thioesterase [Candidatus Cloacimonadaceae bacterium]